MFQAGRLNGIGGAVEPGETPLRAMVREFYEKAHPTRCQAPRKMVPIAPTSVSNNLPVAAGH